MEAPFVLLYNFLKNRLTLFAHHKVPAEFVFRPPRIIIATLIELVGKIQFQLDL